MSPLHRPLNTVQPDLGSARPGWDGDDLLALLVPEPDEAGVLTSRRTAANSNGAVFGGQLIGQALMAAAHGLSPKLAAHSLQLSFLAPGLTDKPLQFDVRRLLSGLNFTIQQVLGRQGERLVFSANVSFHRGETGPDFGPAPPHGVPGPESLPTLLEAVQRFADRIDPAARERMSTSRTLELRPLDAEHFLLEREPSGTSALLGPCQRPPARPALPAPGGAGLPLGLLVPDGGAVAAPGREGGHRAVRGQPQPRAVVPCTGASR
jgi:acyl-CoA thioesterase-2